MLTDCALFVRTRSILHPVWVALGLSNGARWSSKNRYVMLGNDDMHPLAQKMVNEDLMCEGKPFEISGVDYRVLHVTITGIKYFKLEKRVREWDKYPDIVPLTY